MFQAPATGSLSSRSLSIESRALALRLRDIYPELFDDSIELVHEESSNGAKSSRSQTSFRAFGALNIKMEESDIDVARDRDLEIIAINGRLATHGDKLADDILSQIKVCRGHGSSSSK